MPPTRTALALGGGGMFGAYQAGVWKALEPFFRPDIVVGASIGSLNGRAIAGGCPADEWIAQWLELGAAGQLRLHWPRAPFDGLFDVTPLEGFARSLMLRFPPRVRYGVALTSVWPLRLSFTWDADVTWRHICASCGVPVMLRQYRLDGRWYADGGLLDAVPVQGAVEAGATRIVAVNILPGSVPRLVQLGRAALHAVARYRRPPLPPGVQVIDIKPTPQLGRWREAIVWRRDRATAWIERGRKDAEALRPVIESFLITN